MDFVAFEELLSRVEARLIKPRPWLRHVGMVNLYSYNVIGCRAGNTGRFTGMNVQCSFPLVKFNIGRRFMFVGLFFTLVNQPVYLEW